MDTRREHHEGRASGFRNNSASTQKPKPSCESQSADRLRHEITAHEATRRELATVRAELHRRTDEYELIKARFETALHGAKVYVFSQDRELHYTWIYTPRGEDAAAQMIGRSDDDIWTSPEHETVVSLKRRVLETGIPEDCEVSYILPERRALFALHVDPIFSADGAIEGIMCAAIDISRIRSLESEQRRLTEELGTAVQRYETALRGSNVAVFTQDMDLRYTSLSKPLFGLDSTDILGRSDADILSAVSSASLIAMKRDVLTKGEPVDAELRIVTPSGAHWYDFHAAPLRDVTGSIAGLTCAAVDITERKENEAHLRLLMRELTHRSKNLLAVIQAMARQTAHHTGNVESFLERFGARLQALARSHDLLVQESWHGASLTDLIRSQLGRYLDREKPQVSLDGPDVQLRPEAAQSLGLALHELATNAAKHGALSNAKGRVRIEWNRRAADKGGGIEIVWGESKGPKVSAPTKRGFGSMVIERNLARALEADVELAFASEGLRCRVAVPQSQLSGDE